mmetsp:Transcript_14418/g.34902  ORF Transcript_14418/g.34902 Transcript_14418/m.34902 type:complete len:87 (+) Transcript_14418:638-898(+)
MNEQETRDPDDIIYRPNTDNTASCSFPSLKPTDMNRHPSDETEKNFGLFRSIPVLSIRDIFPDSFQEGLQPFKISEDADIRNNLHV